MLTLLLASSCCAGIPAAFPAHAQTLWTGAASDDWFTAGNWNPATVPGAATNVQINTATPNAAVVGAPGALAGQLTIGNGAGETGLLTVDGAGSSLAVSGVVGLFLVGEFGTGTVTVSDGGALSSFTTSIGNQASGVGTVTVTGTDSVWTLTPIFAFHIGSSGTGTLNVLDGGRVSATGGMDVGGSAGGDGTVLMSATGSLLTVSGTANIGSASQGMLTVEAGAGMTAGTLNIGNAATGEATIAGSGTTLGVTNQIRVGFNAGGIGTLTIEDGAQVTSGTGVIGFSAGATGGVTVTGTDSRWTMTNALTISQAASGGSGTLDVLGGGRVDAASFTGHNSARVTVDGAGSQFNLLGAGATTFTLGGSGANNILEATDGAALATKNANLATVAGSGITVTVSGTDTTWNAHSITLGGAGNSAMTVDGGAAVEAVGDFIVDGSANTSLTISNGAQVTQDPGTSVGQFRLGVDGHGSLRIESGGKLETLDHPNFATSTLFARNAGSTANAVITGPGSTWASHGLVTIGSAGTAMLEILDGGTVTGERGVTIGFLSGGSGSVLVSGTDSAWILSEPPPLAGVSSITVGSGGTGSLRVEDGGRVVAQGMTVGGAQSTLAPGSGMVVVTGPGSRLDLNVSTFQSLFVGDDGGTGTIDVLDGAVMTVVGGGHLGRSTVFVGQTPTQALGHGTLTVDGAGSQVTFTSTLDIGEQATGILNVQNGGFVSNTDGYIGSFSNALGSAGVGTATVTGAGSAWQNTGTLRVGDFGTGTLNVLAGGLVTNVNGIVADAAGSMGTSTVSGTDSVWTSTGTLTVGNLGTAVLNIAESGTVNSGAISINALSTLNIGTGGAAGTLNAPSIANAGLIRFNHTGSTTFDTPISGAGNVVKEGAGTTVFEGIHSYTGMTTVNGGTFTVNGTMVSPMTVNAGGTLGGDGTIGAVTVLGNVAPGNSIGVLNVVGPYVQAAGSTYTVEIDDTPASDLINVTGTATIQGGTVAVVVTPGSYVMPTRYTILTASGGVAGTYSGLTANTPFLGFVLDYDANNVYLDIVRIGATFASIAETPNQAAAASGSESLGAGHPVYDAIVPLDAANGLRAFDLLSGEIHASVTGALFDSSRFIRLAINGRLQQDGGGPGAIFAPRLAALPLSGEDQARNLLFDDTGLGYAGDRRDRVRTAVEKAIPPRPVSQPSRPAVTSWAYSFGSWGRAGSDGNAASFRRTDGGFITGMDATLRPNLDALWRIGLAGGFQRTSVTAGARSSSGSVDSAHIAAYAGTQSGPIAIRGGVAYAWHDIATSRSIVFPGFADAARASYRAGTVQVFGEAGYGFRYGTAAMEPFVNLAHVHVHTRAMAENGGVAALTGAARDASLTFSTAGLRVAVPWPVGSGLTAKASLGWRHAFGDVTPQASLGFSGAGSPFTVAGVPLARDSAAIELGLDGEVWRNATLGVAYMGQASGRVQDHGVNASFLSRF